MTIFILSFSVLFSILIFALIRLLVALNINSKYFNWAISEDNLMTDKTYSNWDIGLFIVNISLWTFKQVLKNEQRKECEK